MPTFRAISFASLLCAAVLSSSCASERAPINRVQANALDKKFFVGASFSDPSDNPEFYYRPTVVDVDFGAGQPGLFTASYAQTLARVGFEITQDLLVARLTYQRVADSSNKGSPNDNSGQIVAAFKISSHFDIKHAYNPQTGEELNIIEENTTDRPWYERAFMRVDWSQNLITSAYELDTLAALRQYSDQAIQYEPATYSVSDPASADAQVFEPDQGYFDVTNKVFAKPQVVETPYGTFPTCLFSADFFNGSGPIGNCNPVELKIRLSFRRVEDRDYEAIDWDGQRMSMFGAFTSGSLNPERLGYDRDYGVVDSKWYRFASRHNIWKASHGPNQAGGALCDSDDNCDVTAGSHCDTFVHKCTLPYRNREIRPVAYYYGPESDPTLFDATALAAKDWDSALRHAVQTARYAECVHEHKDGVLDPNASADCSALFPTTINDALAKVPEILVLCHNPVQAGDAAACGAPGLLARVGDLRYHSANVIQSPQSPSPWGIMADAVDPISGEVVAASVNIWNAVTDVAAERTVDLMRWYSGELTTADVTQGDYVKALNQVGSAANFNAYRGPTPMGADEITSRIQSMDRSIVDPKAANVELPTGNAQAVLDWADATTRATFGDGVLGLGNAPIQARFSAVKDTSLETSLVTAPYLSLVGLDDSTPLSPSMLEAASPLRGGYWQNRSALERERQLLLAQNGSCVLSAAEPWGVIELARKMLQKFPVGNGATQISADQLLARNQRWKDYIRKRFTRGVLAHEMGHSMGLRHVFTSSFDALNFRPQYWQLRTRDKQETTYCSAATADGTSCIGPRWNDPVTPAEREGMLTTWQQTSVMDYPGDVTQDMLDIGAYDRAAIRFLYTDVADIWNDPRVSCTLGTPDATGTVPPLKNSSCTADGGMLADQLDSFGGITGAWYGSNTSLNNAIHYSKLDQRLDLIRNCKPADPSPPAGWDEAADGIYDPTIDGQQVNGTECEGIPTDYVRYRDLLGIASRDGITKKFDRGGRVRRPYMFASDEYADIGNISVYRHDNGADAYEIASYFINEYEDVHAFDNHRRGRTTFTLSGAFMRSFTRYHEKLKEMSKAFALLQEIFGGATPLGIPTIVDGPAGDGLSKAHALATSLTFDHFARMLTRPTSGDHFLAGTDAVDMQVLRSTDQALIENGSGGTIALTVPEGTQDPAGLASIGGRPLHNALDGSKGYYTTRYDLWVGSYYEKTLAVDLLADSVDRFISQSRDDFSDGRYRNVSFATLYPEGMRRLISTALTQDADLLGWRIGTTGTKPRVQSGTRYPLSPLGFRVWWPEEGPEMCWPAPGQLACGDAASGVASSTAPATSLALDPEVGFEVQKFVTLFALMYLPDSWKRDWVDLMRIYQLGTNADPGLDDKVAVVFQDPVSGEVYTARSYGRETIEGRSVERGVGARILEWANILAAKAFQVKGTLVGGKLDYATYTDDTNCPPGLTQCTGQPVRIDAGYAARLANYKSVIEFARNLTGRLGFYGPNWRGVY